MVHEIKCERCEELFSFHTTKDLIDFELPKICFECIQRVEEFVSIPETFWIIY